MDKDTIAKLTRRGAADQRNEAMKEIAETLAAYRSALVEGGLPEHEAYFLTRDYSRLLMIKGLWPDSPPPIGND